MWTLIAILVQFLKNLVLKRCIIINLLLKNRNFWDNFGRPKNSVQEYFWFIEIRMSTFITPTLETTNITNRRMTP